MCFRERLSAPGTFCVYIQQRLWYPIWTDCVVMMIMETWEVIEQSVYYFAMYAMYNILQYGESGKENFLRSGVDICIVWRTC